MEDDDRTVVHSSHAHLPEMPLVTARQEGSANALPIGTRLGEFEITGLIGEGGFGIVYLAHDNSLGRQVALKEFMPSGMASRTQTMRVTVRSQHMETFKVGLRSFINEARMLARFDSPSLVKVYRFWEENGTAYMVMPFYEGVTLKQALKDRQVVPDERWLRAMLASLLDAIETIHREKVYHRDIAPDNILILKDGRPLLLDFGAARHVIGDVTQGLLTVILKPGFAPFEQYADAPGMRQGPWTDVYALAAVVYFAITGKTPPISIARIIRDEMPPAREVGQGRYSDHFLSVLDKALAVRPENRIQNVTEFRDALRLEEGVPRKMPEMTSAPAKAVNASAGLADPAAAACRNGHGLGHGANGRWRRLEERHIRGSTAPAAREKTQQDARRHGRSGTGRRDRGWRCRISLDEGSWRR